MSLWRLIPAPTFRAMPWRNGGGTTWEIAQGRIDGRVDGQPEGDWHWRFSLAEIAADGPFSTFPHIDRLLTVIAGAGMALTIDGAAPRFLDQGDDIAFTGEAAVGCTLMSGPTRDLNLMVDRRVARPVRGGEGRMMVAAADDIIVLYALEEVALRVQAERRIVMQGDAIIGGGGAEAVIEQGRAVWARVERL